MSRAAWLAAAGVLIFATASEEAKSDTGLAHTCSAPGYVTDPDAGELCPGRGWERPNELTAVLVCPQARAEDCGWLGNEFRLFGDLPSTALVMICTDDIAPGPFDASAPDPCGNQPGPKPFVRKFEVEQLGGQPTGTVNASWTLPTAYTDGTPLDPLSGLGYTTVYWLAAQACEAQEILSAGASFDVIVPQTDLEIEGLPETHHCLVATVTTSFGGSTSGPSNVAEHDVTAEPGVPVELTIEPVTGALVAVAPAVYTTIKVPDALLELGVGSVSVGTECIGTEAVMIGGTVFYAVPVDAVAWTNEDPDAVRPRVVYAQCGAG